MAEPFIGEIKLFAFSFAPKGWAVCDGQLMSISGNQALYSIIGTTYGGDGRTTFALPDLRGKIPLHPDDLISLGETGGEEVHTLTVEEMAAHDHQARASGAIATSKVSTGHIWAETENELPYLATTNTEMNSQALSIGGGGQAHENRQPYNVLNYCIALVGIFPPRN